MSILSSFNFNFQSNKLLRSCPPYFFPANQQSLISRCSICRQSPTNSCWWLLTLRREIFAAWIFALNILTLWVSLNTTFRGILISQSDQNVIVRDILIRDIHKIWGVFSYENGYIKLSEKVFCSLLSFRREKGIFVTSYFHRWVLRGFFHSILISCFDRETLFWEF